MLHYIALNGFFQFPGQLYTLSLRLLQVSNYKYKTSHAANQITICPTFLSSQDFDGNFDIQTEQLYLSCFVYSYYYEYISIPYNQIIPNTTYIYVNLVCGK